jgi:hypothetical protein
MGVWVGHWHGFGWIGSGEEYKKEHLRRPGKDAGDPATGAFLASSLPAMMTGQNLLRRRLVAADRTWADVQAAVDWLKARYAESPPFERSDGRQAYVDLDAKIVYALDVLPRGVDVTWVHWTQAKSVFSHSVICCPSLHHPEIPCPLPPA